MSDEKASFTINFAIEDNEYEKRKTDCIKNNLERVKDRVKEVFPSSNYEGLVNYTAKLFIEGSFMQEEINQFHQAMNGMEWAKADDNKDAQKSVEETYKNNYLFKEVIRLNFYEGKFRSWKSAKERHKNTNYYKKLVTDKWSSNPLEFPSAEKAGNYFADWLRDEHHTEYEPRTVIRWIRAYAKVKGIKFR